MDKNIYLLYFIYISILPSTAKGKQTETKNQSIFIIHAVSDYKKRSYKKQRWIFVKIYETSTGQVKFKKRIKKLKKRSALRFSKLRN